MALHKIGQNFPFNGRGDIFLSHLMAAIKLRENLRRQGTDAQITYERKHIMRILFDPDDDGWYSWSTASATANDLIQQRTAIRPPIRSDSQFISDL